MTHAMTVRLDEDTARQLIELAASGYPSRSAAVVDAIRQAWLRLQEETLDAAYAADNPHYPYESAEERTASRARRNRREAGE